MATEAPSPELLRRAADGDVRAQNELLKGWLPVVLGWCKRLGGPRVDAQDAAHEVFIVVLRRLETLREGDAFGAWLYGITRRVLRDHRARAWLRRWTGNVSPEIAAGGVDPEEAHASAQTARAVQQILDELPAIHREVLVLCTVEDRTAAEVAVLLGIPPGTVASRLRLARERFKKAAATRALSGVFVATTEAT